MSDAVIHRGDFRDLIDGLEFDVIVTDPPYGNGTDYGTLFEDTPAYVENMAAALAPYLSRAAITSGVANIHRWPEPTWILAWIERAGSGSTPWGFSCWQPVLVYGPDPFLADGKGRRPDLFTGRGGKASSSLHPVAKPLSVMRWIIERVTRPGETVLDPFAGSGTTLVAAKEAGRNAIGIEIDPIFVGITETRLQQDALELDWQAT